MQSYCLFQALEFMSLHREQMKTLVTQDRFTQLEADKNERIAALEKELETLQALVDKGKQSLAKEKSASLQKTDLINNLRRGVEEWRQKVTELKDINTNLGGQIFSKAQEITELLVENKALKDRIKYLEGAIAEVEMRTQMELMLEYKEGKHVNWDPEAVINEYYATFPDPFVSSPENEPRSPPAQDGGGNADTPAA